MTRCWRTLLLLLLFGRINALFNLKFSQNVGFKCMVGRRGFWALTQGLIYAPANVAAAKKENFYVVTDSNSYSALVYAPPRSMDNQRRPLLLVLTGAGKNAGGPWDLADPVGEHAGLPPSLLFAEMAPRELSENFVVVAPYPQGKRSFYEEPRQKLVEFLDFLSSDDGRRAGIPEIDVKKIFLFGFSDGATTAVELATTGRFAASIIASYGFTGTLPPRAVQLLKDKRFWVFHSADDKIFPVSCSDRFVRTLREAASSPDGDIVRYTRFDEDQEGITGELRGHSTGITASKRPEIYSWLLASPPIN